MKRLIATACLACLAFVTTAEIHTAPAAECCSCCSGCPTCAPRWEDKKTKKPKYTMKCEHECVRGFDAWCDHGCCAENTSPCGEVFTKKKLFKREEDKVERVLKYDLTKADCQPCRPAPCNECGPCWCELRDLCRRLFTGW